eukprot:1157614-Pelagomonas_calceolata.AAC.6
MHPTLQTHRLTSQAAARANRIRLRPLIAGIGGESGGGGWEKRPSQALREGRAGKLVSDFIVAGLALEIMHPNA